MKVAKPNKAIPVFLILFSLACAQSTFGQTRIPPRFVDEWYDKRYIAVILCGALFALVTSSFWLPMILPRPHQDDNRRPRIHALIALAVSLAILAAGLLVDIRMVADFGRQTYQFKELFSDVFLSRQTFMMLGMAAAVFALIITLWTRFVSDRFYRYMIIPR